MPDLMVPSIPDSSSIANPDGADAVLGFYNSIGEFARRVKTVLDGTIVDDRMLVVQFVENRDYPLFRNIPYRMEIIATASKSSTGTCTATFKIGTTALGGSTNSVSTTEQIRTHSSANVAEIGDDVIVTISSNSGCEMMELSIQYRRTLIV